MHSFEGTPSQWPVTLRTGNIELRPLKRSDRWEWDAIRQRNAHWLRPWDATSPSGNPQRMGFGRMVGELNRSGRRGEAFPWAITVRDPGATHHLLAGQLIASPVQWGSALSATMGYWLDEDRAGQGIVPSSVALAGDYLLQRVGLHRIEINIVPENAPSHRVVEKLGFRLEGVRRNYLHINGRWADHDSFAVTVEDLEDGGLRARL